MHVSGHASAGELLYLYNVVKPRNVLPVHGEWRHLRANADLAISAGIDQSRVLLADNGVVIDLADGVATIVGAVPVGYVYVDGAGVGDITEVSLTDRRVLGDEGFISVFAALDINAGRVVAGPQIEARGFHEDPTALDPLVEQVRTTLEEALAKGVTDVRDLQQRTRRVVGKWVSATHRRRPMIVPVIVEV